MACQVDIQPLAYADLEEISHYIASERPMSAKRFLLAAENAFDLLAKNPSFGTHCQFTHPLAADIRFWPIKSFKNFLVFYRPIGRGIQVVRVLHGARDIANTFEQDASRDDDE
jgi:toxin ParE1/3/4